MFTPPKTLSEILMLSLGVLTLAAFIHAYFLA